MNIALLIDFEHLRREIANHQTEPRDAAETGADMMARLVARLERDDRDRVVVRRAYADWESMGLAGAPARLMAGGIRPQYVPPGRARTGELELALDAIELAMGRPDLQRFVLLVGDRDMAPLVRRLREIGRLTTVVGFRDAIGADLVEAAGRGGFVPASQLMSESSDDLSIPPRAYGSPMLGEAAPPIVDEDLEATRALLRAARARFGSEVPLVTFYKDFMNPELHHLNNEGRKRLVAELERHGELLVQVRSDVSGVRFAVAVIAERLGDEGAASRSPEPLADRSDISSPPPGSAMLE